MSLKPSKKSDLNKSWMQPRLDRRKMIQPEYHLIVTEGTETEPAYFGAVKDMINHTYPDRVQLVVHGLGDNTLSLLKKAKALAASSANVYKHVWVVYDTDDFPADRVNQTVDLCKEESTEETAYHAIWSNQCIELWFLLHFSFMQSDIHRSSYGPKLSEFMNARHLGKYEKNRKDLFAILFPYIDSAIVNAKKLETINSGRQPSDSCPGTVVHYLIEKLRPYLR